MTTCDTKETLIIEDTYKYTSTDVAIYICVLANERKIFMNITKVQKLLYIVYGVFLRAYQKRLVNEHPQAWPYGPVFPTTRNRLKDSDFLSITIDDLSQKAQDDKIVDDKGLKSVIKLVLENFGSWNAGQLSSWSHSKGSPWSKTTQERGFKWGDTIADRLIYEYFDRILDVKKKA